MPNQNNTVSFLRTQAKNANEFLSAVMADVTTEQARWTPPGVANPLGATYAHIVITQDAIINGTLKNAAPLMAGSWAGKAGVSEPPPAPNPDEPGLPNWSEWARRVKVDLPALREYAQAVYTAADEYLGTLSDEDLNHSLDLSALGLGENTVGFLLTVALVSNVQWHTGEISCLKGLQGVKGYPI